MVVRHQIHQQRSTRKTISIPYITSSNKAFASEIVSISLPYLYVDTEVWQTLRALPPKIVMMHKKQVTIRSPQNVVKVLKPVSNQCLSL